MSMNLKYFDISEFDCTHTGKNEMNYRFLTKLDALRYSCGFPFAITSGYRDTTHPDEVDKPFPGEHTRGIAADIRVRGGYQRYKLVEEAIKMGFSGIGVAKTFVHVDDRPHSADTPVMWPY